MVKDFGEDLTLRKVTTEGSYVPSTGTISGSATTDYSILGYFYTYSSVVGDQVVTGSRRCVVSAVGLTGVPDEGDLIVGNGDTVVISSVETIFSNGSAVCYICHVEE